MFNVHGYVSSGESFCSPMSKRKEEIITALKKWQILWGPSGRTFCIQKKDGTLLESALKSWKIVENPKEAR